MDKSTVIFVGMILIVSGATIGISSLFWSFLDYEDTYSITYDLDGGINHPDNPDSYQYGDKIELLAPTKYGYIFLGWFDSEGKQYQRIDPLMFEDVTLYAMWEINLVGRTMSYDLSGTCNNELHLPTSPMPVQSQRFADVSGEYSLTYLEYDMDKGYLVDYAYSYTITPLNGGEPSVLSGGEEYWTSEDESDTQWFVESETQKVRYKDSTYDAEVYYYTEYEAYGLVDVLTTYERQWIVDDWMPCRIEVKSLITKEPTNMWNSYLNMIYTLTDVSSIDPNLVFDIRVFGDEGIDASGSGTYDAFGSAKLVATVDDGMEFVGWYTDGGSLLSTSSTYTVPAVTGDMDIYAVNSNKRDVTLEKGQNDSITKDYGMDDGVWELLDDDGSVVTTSEGNQFTYRFDEPGIYVLRCFGTVDDVPTGRFLNVFLDGQVTKTYEWKDNGGESHTLSIDILYSDYLAYSEADVVRNSQMYYDYHGNAIYTEDVKFVTYGDRYVVEIAQEFMDRKAENGWNDAKLLDVVLTLTQYIPYQLDEDYMGQNEYWKFPVETLFENGGDCEDTSILFSAIVKAMGYDTALLLFNDHMAASVSYDGQPTGYDVYVGKDGKSYLYCETTAKNYTVGLIATGSIPNKYHPENCLAVMVVPSLQ